MDFLTWKMDSIGYVMTDSSAKINWLRKADQRLFYSGCRCLSVSEVIILAMQRAYSRIISENNSRSVYFINDKISVPKKPLNLCRISEFYDLYLGTSEYCNRLMNMMLIGWAKGLIPKHPLYHLFDQLYFSFLVHKKKMLQISHLNK